MEEIFLGVMDLQEAKNHQLKLKAQGIEVNLKVNGKTCTTGCKVTVEVWGNQQDSETLAFHFRADFLKNVKGHEPNLENLAQVFDPTANEVTCQACGTKFAPTVNECPDCGLMY
jgi:ribosomal protein S27E